MKVTGAKVYLATIDRLHPVLVEVATDEGITGTGEAAVAYGIGGTAAAGMIRDLLQAMVLGKDPFRIEELWSDMYDHSFWAKGGGSIVFAGMSAIEQALWDIKGKALGIPVYEFLGGKCRDQVRTYANGWSYASHTRRNMPRRLSALFATATRRSNAIHWRRRGWTAALPMCRDAASIAPSPILRSRR
jgi:galactonate dehydratase